MSARPAAAACLGVLLAAVAGCASTDSPAAAPSSSAPAPATSASPADPRTPLQILMAGIPTDTSVAYHFSITSVDGPTYGVIDPAMKTTEYDVVSGTHYTDHPDYTMTLKVLSIGKKAWAKVVLVPDNISGLAYIPRRWMVLAPSKIKGGLPNGLQKDSDPAYAIDILANVSDATQTSPGHFKGITDLTDSGNKIVGATWITALGDAATKLPFTAALDAKGRLTTMSVVMPAAAKFPAFTYKLVYDQYATATAPKAPTGAIKAIPEVYKWLGY
ncbi:hypothetical protein [Mycobacterium sp.]|uniref:hypothetical protein n=1 Tax=Mycobacterium sp. TaxID=1785 RepID=UPI00260DD2AD|nr:hypothetical protein [Mycobacterium sp.]